MPSGGHGSFQDGPRTTTGSDHEEPFLGKEGKGAQLPTRTDTLGLSPRFTASGPLSSHLAPLWTPRACKG